MLTLGVCAVIPQIPIAFAQVWLVREASPLDLPVSFASTLYGEVTFAAVVFASAKAASGDAPDAFESLGAALQRLGTIFEFLVRYLGSVVLLALTIVGIPFAIRVLVRWFFGTEAIMLRDLNAKDAITLSCRITSGHRWRLAGVFLLLTVFAVPFLAGPFLVNGELTIAAWATLSLVTVPLGGCFWTLVFLDLEKQTVAGQMAPLPVS